MWTARDLMASEVRTIGPDATLVDLERALLEADVSGFPVVEDGKLIGVVARSDVVRQLVVEQSLAETVSDYYRDPARLEPERTLEEIGQMVGHRIEHLTVRDVMVAGIVSSSAGDSIGDVARKLVDNGIHRILVTDGDRLVGIVSALDFARLFADGRAVARNP